MEYRKLPHGSENISILGMGTSSIGASGEKEIRETLRLALENGINYFDMASADAAPFAAFGKELGSARKNVYFQIHFVFYLIIIKAYDFPVLFKLKWGIIHLHAHTHHFLAIFHYE